MTGNERKGHTWKTKRTYRENDRDVKGELKGMDGDMTDMTRTSWEVTRHEKDMISRAGLALGESLERELRARGSLPKLREEADNGEQQRNENVRQGRTIKNSIPRAGWSEGWEVKTFASLSFSSSPTHKPAWAKIGYEVKAVCWLKWKYDGNPAGRKSNTSKQV